MDKYWSVDTTFYKVDYEKRQTLELSTYDRFDGRRAIAAWHFEENINDADYANVSLVYSTLLLARLNVQLGLDLGLLS